MQRQEASKRKGKKKKPQKKIQFKLPALALYWDGCLIIDVSAAFYYTSPLNNKKTIKKGLGGVG